ncbi:MAG TPA: hypothetical protein VKM35_02925 [Arenimonas sp.]|nr:hypothetical protein [Arenimonas sp.]
MFAAMFAGLAAWLFAGPGAGVAAAIGGSSIALGNAVMAHFSLGGGVLAPRVAFARLLLGAIFKWALVVLVWWGAMAVLKKAPLAALFGLLAAMAIHPIAIIFGAKVKRER